MEIQGMSYNYVMAQLTRVHKLSDSQAQTKIFAARVQGAIQFDTDKCEITLTSYTWEHATGTVREWEIKASNRTLPNGTHVIAAWNRNQFVHPRYEKAFQACAQEWVISEYYPEGRYSIQPSYAEGNSPHWSIREDYFRVIING